MTKFRHLTAMGATVAVVVLGDFVSALGQDVTAGNPAGQAEVRPGGQQTSGDDALEKELEALLDLNGFNDGAGAAKPAAKSAEPAQQEKRQEPPKAKPADDLPLPTPESEAVVETKPATERETIEKATAAIVVNPAQELAFTDEASDEKEEKKPAEKVAEVAAEPVVAEEPVVAKVEEPVVAEEPAAAKVDEPAVAEEPVVAKVDEPAEEPKPVEEPVAVAEEPVAVAEEPVVAKVEEPVEEPKPVEEPAAVAEEPAAKAEEPAAQTAQAPADIDPAKLFTGKDAELLSSAYETELIRRRALEEQALREIADARRAMGEEEYLTAVKHYRNASHYITDGPKSTDMRKECRQGIAEGYYLAALQEDRIGRRERAMKLMDKAVTHRHPKARKQLETWKAADDPDANKTAVSSIRHRINETEYQEKRDRFTARLKRARQLMSTRELDAAQEECELVLKEDKYNEEAHALRRRIIAMRRRIYATEIQSSRDGMIAEVDRAWRPVYATKSKDAKEAAARTIKKVADDDPERRQEQNILKRMKEMRIPAISFKPPMTIADAVEFFNGASRDYDRPDLPIEQRGFNIILRTPEAIRAPAAQNAAAAGNEFAVDDEAAAGAQQNQNSGLPVIPYISASNLTFWEALKYVCDSVDYKFKVQGPMVIVMHKDISIDEMATRSYPVLSSFIERVDSASSALREMKTSNAAGGGMFNAGGDDGGGEKQERDWKELFRTLGIDWPEGSSITYMKPLGKLFVKNTYENLAELERLLNEMNAEPRLIEIEARFVEVCQEDLSSLGFEWILNSDYSLGLGSHLSRLLRVRDGKYGSLSSATTTANSSTVTTTPETTVADTTSLDGPPAAAPDTSSSGTANTGTSTSASPLAGTTTLNPYMRTVNADWVRSGRSHHGNMGLDAINGTSVYKTGQRWLSDLGNHVSGEGVSNNDQFMRLNAYIGAADLSLILHMLAQRSDTDLLSAPKVLTRHGEEAVMKVVTEFIYPTDYDVQLQSSRSGGWNDSGQSAILAVVEPQSFVMREVGVILQATPTLTDDGQLIDLKLKADVVDEPTWKNYGMRIPYSGNSSTVDFSGIQGIFTGLSSILTTLGASLTKEMNQAFAETAVQSASTALDNLSSSANNNITYYDAPMEQPFFHVRSVDSSVSVYPGATIVMGGLITEARRAMDDKIPFLGDLPFIGRLFRSHSEKTTKRNLLIFVTTRLVDVSGREVTLGADKEEKAPEQVQPAPAAKEQP